MRPSAMDLWPLVAELPHDELLQLARLALRAAAGARPDANAYRAEPPAAGEFSAEDDPLAWDGEGWEHLDAAR